MPSKWSSGEAPTKLRRREVERLEALLTDGAGPRVDRARCLAEVRNDGRIGGERMNEAEMQAELARLRAENDKLKNKNPGGLSLKVSEKGGVSLYGLGRFPVTLYKEQWMRLLTGAKEIETFIRENEAKLKTKE